ncbi:hypothetical protein PF005_g5282 [Phytophthora fragariae]|uniref:Uncharacterized protein n=1 Tax=Phytophthora fragariae TaxID=53985 RepID=A0A6A3FJ63_9STRA|nr:hypothetical protein PF009_g4543 [Phytophthora fragariae]KAE9226054.1 hypothetical protein PF005_g5282 [Phytophthora fragariae]KAE9248186.1 hypothetical protein PF002_g5913 [Phytophthora fragariae]
MSVLTKQEKSVHVGLEKFSGRQVEYATWKDNLLTHVAQLDLEAENRLLESGEPDPKVGMKDFQESTPPCLTDADVKAASPENRLAIRKEIMVWRKPDAAMRHVLNMTFPNSFLSCLPDDVRNLEVCVIWQHLERKFANGDAGGLVAWSNRWNRILNSNWKDTMTLFSSLNQARNEMNRKSKKLIGKEMMTETMISKKMITGSGDVTTVARINHVKKEREMRGYDAQKRKSDGSAKVQDKGCFYCFGQGHQQTQCERMKADRDPNREGGPLLRTNVQAQPSKKTANGTKKIATVQHAAKKQRTTYDPPTDVEMEEEFKLPASDKAESGDENGGCLLSFDEVDARELDSE